MEDPIVLDLGISADRTYLLEYIDTLKSRGTVLPKVKHPFADIWYTEQQIRSMSPNVALKNVIERWRRMNERRPG